MIVNPLIDILRTQANAILWNQQDMRKLLREAASEIYDLEEKLQIELENLRIEDEAKK